MTFSPLSNWAVQITGPGGFAVNLPIVGAVIDDDGETGETLVVDQDGTVKRLSEAAGGSRSVSIFDNTPRPDY